ncbi:MAG: MarR family transcriptional regulator [Alphaproteobacteria bacterium]|jgi:DNA-binding MarR family transcriptional regulator|nr:MarR family transcriptional regulator [Alphaproteobacteria bacterium]|tara:strand:+ start:131 stop:601 length:471 start_codon:yes stop_codon:yes gene_type:complete
MDQKELDRSIGFLAHDVSRLLRRNFDRRAKTLGLTRSQWRVLLHLQRTEGINQAGLADILEVEPITLTRLLDRLNEAGWVERRADPNDRRAWRLYLTPKTAPVLERMRELATDMGDEALAGLSPPERDRLIDQLLLVKANLCGREAEVKAPGEAAE